MIKIKGYESLHTIIQKNNFLYNKYRMLCLDELNGFERVMGFHFGTDEVRCSGALTVVAERMLPS